MYTFPLLDKTPFLDSVSLDLENETMGLVFEGNLERIPFEKIIETNGRVLAKYTAGSAVQELKTPVALRGYHFSYLRMSANILIPAIALGVLGACAGPILGLMGLSVGLIGAGFWADSSNRTALFKREQEVLDKADIALRNADLIKKAFIQLDETVKFKVLATYFRILLIEQELNQTFTFARINSYSAKTAAEAQATRLFLAMSRS